MEPFPPRNVITGRHNHHYSKIKDQWLLREKELKEREVRSKLEKLQKKPVGDERMSIAYVIVLCSLAAPTLTGA